MSDNVTLIIVLIVVLVFMAGMGSMVIILLKYFHRDRPTEPEKPSGPEPMGPEHQIEDQRETD